MALTPFFGRGISAWDPWENNLFDPWLPISRVSYLHRQFAGTKERGSENRFSGEEYSVNKRGQFMRQFRLPENVNVDGISAKLENGVLTVNAPKTHPDAANGGYVKSIGIGST
ncbi:hypothetical protein SUGI_0538900 [Cryptomeria japonica]|nr:hypothetical protein SUGI_0538900 [Cryptomeria japonica]